MSSICTDRAVVLRGINKGLVGILRKNGVSCPAFHCIIHQQALFSKEVGMQETMAVALKIINKIKGGHNALNHRKFKEFLEQLQADYGDLLLYTEVRWLSRGRSLERLYNLRSEILEFFRSNAIKDTGVLIESLENENFLLDLAFLCDITGILNDLNLILQGKNKKISELVTAINHFTRKLELLNRELTNNNFNHLKRTACILTQTNVNYSDKTQQFCKTVQSLLTNSLERFKDFQIINKTIGLHDYPLICNIEEQDINLHDELKNLYDDFEIPLENGENFWKSIDEKKYPKLKNEMFKLYAMFGSTYNCEVAFSSMKIILSKQRNKISDKHLADLMRIKEYKGNIDLDDVINFSNFQDIN